MSVEQAFFKSALWNTFKAYIPVRLRRTLSGGLLKIKRWRESLDWIKRSPRYIQNWPAAFFWEVVLPKDHYLKYILRHAPSRSSTIRHLQLTIRAKSYDKFIVQEICTGAYDIALKDLPTTPTVIDAGAHIGVFSTEVIRKFPSARLVCIEPMPENIILLKKNIKDNYDSSKVVIVEGVLTNKSDDQRIYNRKDHSAGFNLYMPTENSESVRSYTLEKILADNNIEHCDLLKLDIEGSEYEVLFGAQKHILARVQRIVMEYHPFPKEMADKDKLARFLNAQGFVTTFYAKKLMYAERK